MWHQRGAYKTGPRDDHIDGLPNIRSHDHTIMLVALCTEKRIIKTWQKVWKINKDGRT